MKYSLLLCALLLSNCPLLAKTYALQAHGMTLRLARATTGDFGLQLDAGDVRFEQKTPLALEVVDATGSARWMYGAYTRVTAAQGAVQGTGELRSAHGTLFRFVDIYRGDSDGFQLQRRVTIAAPNPQDVGFSSRFGLAWATPMTTSDCDILMPGAWYRDNRNVPPAAFAANINDQVLLHREDRLGLPLVLARAKKSGAALVLEHVGGYPGTFAGDDGSARIIDERVQVGALGWLNAGHLEATFAFPGTEDERPDFKSEASSTASRGSRFEPRSHPVKIGVAHAYTLHFGVQQTADFPSAIALTTRASIARAQPPLVQADLKRVYRASLDLLNTVIQPYNGTVAVPFQVSVPDGAIKDSSSQMGFVGMALPCAALLLRDGLKTGNQSAIERAVKVLDFWAQQSPEPSGVPKTWCDFPADGRVTWRTFSTHLRVASDGMTGVLQAWKVARQHGIDKPQWLSYARNYGDWLVAKQNADGSWFGSWNFDGTPHDRFTNASTHPLTFLIDLARATGDNKYQQAALHAGEFCWRTVHQEYAYVGGTPDNPNVTDKEAGVMAVQGFLALYDATGDRKWLDATCQAAIFCETWIYWRDLPMPIDNPRQVFPAGRTTVGLSLISTGHAGADNFMAFAPFLWYRLYVATDDAHFLYTARLLLHDTKQIMDWDGKLGYKYAGLMPEAMSLSLDRGRGVAGWLPWLTWVAIEPLARLQDTFGSMDIDQIEKLPLQQRRDLSLKFGATRGF